MQCYVTFDATTYGIRRGMFIREILSKPYGATIEMSDGVELFIPDRNWFIKYKSAVKNCEKQRAAKIKQLEKQIERIRKMEFK